MKRKKVVHACILGAGTAGMAAVYALKSREFEVAIVEKQKILGGQQSMHGLKHGFLE